jgi:ligand-binding sensor domain-containing protein
VSARLGVWVARLIALTCCLTWTASPSFALDPRRGLSHYSIDTWREPEGLKQDCVRAIAQTRDGYLWVGTPDGLLRFDGVRFVSFNVDTGSLKDNEVWALKADPAGGLWIASFGGGVAHYKDGRFTSLTTADGLPDDFVWNLDIDSTGDLWISGIQAVYRYSKGKFTTFVYGEGEYRDRLTFVCAGPHGEVYASSARRVYRYVEGRFREEPEVVINQGLISHMCVSPVDGALWIGLNNGILKRLKDGQVTTFGSR